MRKPLYLGAGVVAVTALTVLLTSVYQAFRDRADRAR